VAKNDVIHVDQPLRATLHAGMSFLPMVDLLFRRATAHPPETMQHLLRLVSLTSLASPKSFHQKSQRLAGHADCGAHR